MDFATETDVLLVAGPVSPERRRSIVAEADLLRSAGFAVQAAGTGAQRSGRSKLAVLTGPPETLLLARDRLRAARILIRVRACDRPAAVVAAASWLEAEHGCPVQLAPETGGIRKRLRHLPTVRCTGDTWAPAVDPMLAIARGRPVSRSLPRRVDVASSALGDDGRDAGMAVVDALHPGTLLVVHGEPPGRADLLPAAIRVLNRRGLFVASRAWRAQLDAAALLVPPGDLASTAAALACDAQAFASAREQVVDAALLSFGEDSLVSLAHALVLQGLAGPGPRTHDGVRHAATVIAGDFTRRDEPVLHALAEARTRRERGDRLLLCHLPELATGRGGIVHPGFDAMVRDGAAAVFDPTSDVATCDELVVFDPDGAAAAIDSLRPQLRPKRVLLLSATIDCNRAQASSVLERRLKAQFGAPCTWRSIVPRGLELGDRYLGAGIPPGLPAFSAAAPVANARPRRPRPVVGCVVFSPEAALRAVERLHEAKVQEFATLRILATWAGQDAIEALRRLGVEVLDLDGCDIGRFVRGCDALCAPPGAAPGEVAWTALATAQRLGLPVLLPPGLGHAGCPALPLEAWQERLAVPLAAVGPRRRGRAAPAKVLFVTANGVGLGHLTRLAAIARRLPRAAEAVFATMSQAVPVLHQLGFRAELLTSYAGHPAAPWNGWLQRRLAEIVDAERPGAVVLDASNPYPGVLGAVAARADPALVWVRRGMWRAEQDNGRFLAHEAAFDLVIEPADIAEGDDRGATATTTSQALRVPPISLLDERDLLPAAQARARLDIDPSRPAVLIQLGSGTTRNLPALLDRIVSATRRFPGLQVVHAEWLIGRDDLDLWPELRRLRGFPIARYFRAFDFTITAAGYNSFNDVLRFGLPAIFIANDAPMMDDQGARARFAQACEAGFDLREDALDDLEACIEALLEPRVRGLLAANGRRLARDNGATAAARAIAALASRGVA